MNTIAFSDEIREAFEKWYCDTYWNFKIHNVVFNKKEDCYNDMYINLVYNAYQAGFIFSLFNK